MNYSTLFWATDAGIKELVLLTELQALSLRETRITDRAIPDLLLLKNLKTLNLASTSVSQEGVKTLRERLPKCEIRR